MDFRRTKLFLALRIMAVGMVVALVWHGFQGWVLHRGYPYNTFLGVPEGRFGDLTQVVHDAQLPSPYQSIWGGYMPVSFKVFGYLAWLSPFTGILLYISVGVLGLWAVTILALRPMLFDPRRVLVSNLEAIGGGTLVALLSYPLLIAVDRANVELIMVLLVAMALLCFHGRRPELSFVFLFPAICFKLYPALLLGLYLRPGYRLKIFLIGVVVVLVNLVCLGSYAGGLVENWRLWQRDLHFMNDFYIIQSGQLHGSASLWNAGKALLATGDLAIWGLPANGMIVLPKELVERLYVAYGFLSLMGTLLIGVACVLWEAEFFRRAILLLILMSLLVPSGGDYRLLYANMALVILILLPGRRARDLKIVGLLALMVIPKKEIFFPYLGVCDSRYTDTALATFLNAPCMLFALIWLIKDLLEEPSCGFWRQRLRRVVGPLAKR